MKKFMIAMAVAAMTISGFTASAQNTKTDTDCCAPCPNKTENCRQPENCAKKSQCPFNGLNLTDAQKINSKNCTRLKLPNARNANRQTGLQPHHAHRTPCRSQSHTHSRTVCQLSGKHCRIWPRIMEKTGQAPPCNARHLPCGFKRSMPPGSRIQITKTTSFPYRLCKR